MSPEPQLVTASFYGALMPDVPVDIIRSPRRKRTISATLTEGRLRVRVPAGLEPAEETRLVDQAKSRVLRRAISGGVDLQARAVELANRYGLRRPTSIVWSTRQMQRWGSCSPDEGRIRISDRLAAMPSWVLDSVIVHELAHLEVPDHGPGFRTLIERYELTERARGYLMAKGDGI
ncbi:MAG: M48 family metallopeptidase [Acidimicrobiia bacterium]